MDIKITPEFVKKLAKIQKELKAPKNQTNSFGKYKYRSCEDILEAVKPLLGDMILTINDEVIMLGDRFYVKATATITDGENEKSNSAYAREALDKRGMDDSQITGATSSYARKYALNGLLCIDDTKDADSDEHTEQTKKPVQQNKPAILHPDCITEVMDCKTLLGLQIAVNKWAKTENVDLLKKLAGEIKLKITTSAQPTIAQVVGDDLPENLK